MINDKTKYAVRVAREMLEMGIKIQAIGDTNDATMTGIIQALLYYIDELELNLKTAIAAGQIAVQEKEQALWDAEIMHRNAFKGQSE